MVLPRCYFGLVRCNAPLQPSRLTEQLKLLKGLLRHALFVEYTLCTNIALTHMYIYLSRRSSFGLILFNMTPY